MITAAAIDTAHEMRATAQALLDSLSISENVGQALVDVRRLRGLLDDLEAELT